MSIVSISDSTGAVAELAVEKGFNCFRYAVIASDGDQVELLDCVPEFPHGEARPSSSGIPLLFPFPNRIENATYEWDGKTYQLPPGNGPHAIHGFCLDKPWRVTRQTESSVTAEFQLSVDAPDRAGLWPADFVIRATYQLEAGQLRADYEFHNPDSKPLPWGFGTHPYFKLPFSGDSNVSHCDLIVPATSRWELEGCIPTGKIVDSPELQAPGHPIDQLTRDDVYTDVASENGVVRCEITDSGRNRTLIQQCPDHYREMVIFTPRNRDAVCIEPYTCPTNAINMKDHGKQVGWHVLAPGETFSTWITIELAS